MVILINTIPFFKKNKNHARDLYVQYFISIAKKNAQWLFVLAVDESFSENTMLPENFLIEKVKSTANVLASNIRKKFQLQKIIKTHKPDILINVSTFYPGKTIAQKFLLFDTTDFIHSAGKKFITIYDQSEKVIVNSKHVKETIVEKLPADKKKIEIIYHSVKNIFTSVDQDKKLFITTKYTEGKEYFLCDAGYCTSKELISLTRAFSQFKKWQKSNMKLVLITEKTKLPGAFAEALHTYKYRNEVIVISELKDVEAAGIYASAYCVVKPDTGLNYLVMLKAMRSGVPVIAAKNIINEEISGDAVLYTDSNVHEDMAKNMILLYKDENTRNKLIQKGAEQSEKYSDEYTQNRFLDLILLHSQL